MLTIDLDSKRVTSAQNAYLGEGTRRGVHMADRVRILRDAFRHAARRFGQRQAAAAAKGEPPLLSDGRQATLEAELFAPLAGQGWPKRGAAVLHGLHLPGDPLLAAVPCCNGGPDLSDLDPESYATRLDDGPPQARSYGDATALVVYFAPLNQMRILWIGAESDYAAALAALHADTAAGWQSVVPDYADWLDAACRAALGQA